MSPDRAGNREGEGLEMPETTVETNVASVPPMEYFIAMFDLVDTVGDIRQPGERLPSPE